MAARTHNNPRVHTRIPVATHGTNHPRRIIIHSTESINRPGMSDVIAIPNFWRAQGKGYGTHLVIDGDGNTVKCALDNRITWGCAGSNSGSLQIELIGSASMTAAQWKRLDVGIKQAAKWCAYWCERWDIPITLDVNRGIATHGMHSKAFGVSDHTDPGKNFPLTGFLRRVRYYHKEGWLAEPNP